MNFATRASRAHHLVSCAARSQTFTGTTTVRNITTTVEQKAQSSPLAELGRKAALTSKIPSSDDPTSTVEENIARTSTNPQDVKAHHFHVYATKHNCHITLTNHERNSLMSFSAGNIGFRKAARGTYDAAYQLAAYTLGRIYEGGLLGKIKKLEVVLRGFGVGREAVTKALLGAEGRLLRAKITQVSDATRLKFGGTRSKKPRRLG